MSEVRIGTFNIAGGVHPDLTAVNRLITRNGLDVIGIQELDRQTKRNPYDMPVVLAGDNYAIEYAPAMAFEGGEYGIGLLSKKKGEAVTSTFYSKHGEEERVFQRASYTFGEKTLTVYNTHLSFETPALRVAQVEELLAAIKKDQPEYWVICGDFNMDQSLDEWQIFSEFESANSAKNGFMDTFIGRDDAMKTNAIDNIIVSATLKIEEITLVDTILSDHRLLTARVSFR